MPGSTVITLSGAVTIEDAEDIELAVLMATNGGPRRVTIDVGDVSLFDYGGLGALLTAQQQLNGPRGGGVHLTSTRSELVRLLRVGKVVQGAELG